MTIANTHSHIARAVFQSDNLPDIEARVMVGPEDRISFSVRYADSVSLIHHVPADQNLQASEALQFVADTIGSTVPGRMSAFVRGWIGTAADIHHTAKEKGFWEDGEDRNNGEMLCLIHSEISEALEALRKGNPPDDKVPEFSGVETELADAVIRIMDLAHARGWRVPQAIEAKMKFNAGRAYKHGKEF